MPRRCSCASSKGAGNPGDADLFRGQMLTEMARMSLDDELVLQIHPGAWRNHNAPLFDRFGAERRRRHSHRHRLRRRAAPAAQSLRQRSGAVDHRVHARREHLRARARAARRALSGAQARPGVVVPRQPGRHDAIPRANYRDRGFLQHRRLQRRHARVPVDSCRATMSRAASTARSSRAWWPSTACRKTKPRCSRRSSLTNSRKKPTNFERRILGGSAE